jgi:transporter family protein
MQFWFIMSAVALVFFGLTGITQKLSTNHISFEASMLWCCIAMASVSVVVAIFVPLDWRVSPGLFALAALGGLLNGLGALTSFAAFEKGGKASIVIPIINLYPIVTIGGAWLFLGEKLTATQVAGIVCALAAVVFLSLETPSGNA